MGICTPCLACFFMISSICSSISYSQLETNSSRYNHMESEPAGKYIRTIKLAFNKDYAPNRHFSVYDFMNQLNEAVKKRYDLEVVEVYYMISKSKLFKDFDSNHQRETLMIEGNFNNVFDNILFDQGFLRTQIMNDVVLLKPPQDYDPSEFEDKRIQEKELEEEKQMNEISNSIDMVCEAYSSDPRLVKSKFYSLAAFKREKDDQISKSDIEIYAKAIINFTVENRLEAEKSTRNPIIIPTGSGKFVQIYMHPDTKKAPESLSNIHDLSPISGWTLGCISDNAGYHYLDSNTLNTNVEQINKSIVLDSSIFLKYGNGEKISSLELQCGLFNATVLKISTSVAQILKVERYSQATEEGKIHQFYFYLKYPPVFEIKLLKKNKAIDDRYLSGWERVENFPLLRNKIIKDDDFVRLFLFNNSILCITLEEGKMHISAEKSIAILERISKDFGGIIKVNRLEKKLEFLYKMKQLKTKFKYAEFKNKLDYSLDDQLKIWKLKYLLIVLIRLNALHPEDASKILEEVKDEIDLFIYILWKAATNVWRKYEGTFLDYVMKEYQIIKQINIKKISKRQTSNTDTIAYVFKALLTPSGYIYDPPTPEMKGRLLKEMSNQSELFIRVKICDDNQGSLMCKKYITKFAFRKQMDSINILKRQYKPLGWSGSQLRAFSLWYVYETEINHKMFTREYILSFLGDFKDVTPIAKKAARIGQNFSASWTFDGSKIKQVKIDDVWSNTDPKRCFTDGIGKISKDILESISNKLKIRELSVVQIRYKGAKGVLVIDDQLQKSTVHLRPSMIKFKCEHDAAKKYLDILDWNKYKPGFLNRQIIILLRTLGIKDSVFERLQEEHIKDISSMTFKDCSIFKNMDSEMDENINNLEPANETILNLLRAGFTLEEEPFFRGVLETMKKNGYHQLKIKSKINIKRSARIIGIIDQYGVLEEGEVYCTVYDHFQERPQDYNVVGNVIVTRNPCLNPADIRKLKCVSTEEIEERFTAIGKNNKFKVLVNCVIFPMKGKSPITAQISGSDLDGDNFFISWEPTLLPESHAEPDYIDDRKFEDKRLSTDQYKDMLDFFINYLNYEKLGQIDNSHLVHADMDLQLHARNSQCLELAQIHGKAVDFPKTGHCPFVSPKLLVSCYPDFFEKGKDVPEYTSMSILGKLYRDIKSKIQNLLEEKVLESHPKIDQDLIGDIRIKDFDKKEILETVRWLLQYEKDLSSLMSLVEVDTEFEIYSGNFSTSKEKVKTFGNQRLINTIQALRGRCFQQFFDDQEEEAEKYQHSSEEQLRNIELFKVTTRQKAVLYYLVSYILKFPMITMDEKHPETENLQYLKNEVVRAAQSLHYLDTQRSLFGFVWFVIPKLMITQKIRSKKIQKIAEKKAVKGDEEEQVQENEQFI